MFGFNSYKSYQVINNEEQNDESSITYTLDDCESQKKYIIHLQNNIIDIQKKFVIMNTITNVILIITIIINIITLLNK